MAENMVEEQTDKNRICWINEHVRSMLALYKEVRPNLGESIELKNKAAMWNYISKKLQEQGYYYTGHQVENKWNAIKRRINNRKMKTRLKVQFPEEETGNESINEEYCRVCKEWRACQIDLKSKPESTDVLANVATYLDCYNFLLKSNIELNDENSSKLCKKCSEDLIKAFSFAYKVNQVEQQLDEIDPIQLDEDQLSELQIEDENDVIIHETKDTKFAEINTEVEFEQINALEDFENEHLFPDDEQFENIAQQWESQKEIVKTDLTDEIFADVPAVKKFYRCRYCKQTKFDNLKEYMEHHKNEHGPKEYACKLCGKIFKKKHYLLNHLDRHKAKAIMKEEIFKCTECERTYKSKASLKNHERLHTGKVTPCDVCHKPFVCKKDLAKHMRFHTKDFPYVCEICGRKFALSSHLNQHTLRHKNMKCECPECGKLFLVVASLYEHYYKHTGELPYPCSYCKRAYPSFYKYKFHLLNSHKVDPTEEEMLKSRKNSKVDKKKKPKFRWVSVEDGIPEAKDEDESNPFEEQFAQMHNGKRDK